MSPFGFTDISTILKMLSAPGRGEQQYPHANDPAWGPQ